MAIEIRQLPPERAKRRRINSTRIIQFDGGIYCDTPNDVRSGLLKNVGSPTEVTLVRFTTRDVKAKRSYIAEYTGAVGKAVVAEFFRKRGKSLNPSAESILTRVFGIQSDEDTHIGARYENGKLTIPRDTGVDIETTIPRETEEERPILRCTTAFGEVSLTRKTRFFSIRELKIELPSILAGVVRTLILSEGHHATFMELFDLPERRARRGSSSPFAIVTRNIEWLRKELGKYGSLIENVPGEGFKFKMTDKTQNFVS